MGLFCKLEGHLEPSLNGETTTLPVEEIEEMIKNDKRIQYDTEWIIEEGGIYGRDCDKSGGQYLDVLKLIIDKVLKPKRIQLNGFIYYEHNYMKPSYGIIWVNGNTIKTLSGIDALKNKWENQKTFEWTQYWFSPKYQLKKKTFEILSNRDFHRWVIKYRI